MSFFKGAKLQSGQILLIVVLTMIVALTVGLSIAARVVTELKLSKQNEESQRAFQAAESGIQQTLESGSAVGSLNNPIPLENNSFFSTLRDSDNGPAIILNNGQEVDQAVGADVWLSDYSADPAKIYKNPMGVVGGVPKPVAITLYWGTPGQSCAAGTGQTIPAAIEVILLQGSSNNPTIAKSIFEANGCNRGISNPTDTGTTAGGPFLLKNSTSFLNKVSLTFNGASLSNGLVMKVIPIFNSSVIGFQSQDTADPNDPYPFPAQGSVVTSTGTSGDTVRKVVYYQSYPQLPLEIFPYSLISQ